MTDDARDAERPPGADEGDGTEATGDQTQASDLFGERDASEETGDDATARDTPESTAGGQATADPAESHQADDAEGAPPGVAARMRGRLSAGTRSTLTAYGTVIVIACLLVAAGGGYLTYTAMTASATQTETVTEAEWTTDTEFAHGVTVQEGTAVFDRGEQLRDRPVYFARLAPELEGRYIVSHGGDVEAAIGTVELQLVIEATEGRGDDEIVHWRETEPLASEEVSNLSAGEETVVPFAIDTAELTLRVGDITDELGASPGSTEIRVVADTVLETEAAGDPLSDERTDELTLDLNTNVDRVEEDNSTVIDVRGGTYSVEERVTEPHTQSVTTTRTVPVEPSPLEAYGGPVLFVVGLLAAGGGWLASRRGVFAVSAAERRRLSFARARSDYAEWISRGHPPESEPRRRIHLDSLADLVNVAIDSNRRVIEQLAPARYAVWIDDIEYVFDPPPALADRITPDDDGGVTVAVDDPVETRDDSGGGVHRGDPAVGDGGAAAGVTTRGSSSTDPASDPFVPANPTSETSSSLTGEANEDADESTTRGA